MVDVSILIKHKDGYDRALRIHDPVLQDPGCGVVCSLFAVIALGVIGADNLDYKVSTNPVAVFSSWIGGVLQQDQVRFAVATIPDTES